MQMHWVTVMVRGYLMSGARAVQRFWYGWKM